MQFKLFGHLINDRHAPALWTDGTGGFRMKYSENFCCNWNIHSLPSSRHVGWPLIKELHLGQIDCTDLHLQLSAKEQSIQIEDEEGLPSKGGGKQNNSRTFQIVSWVGVEMNGQRDRVKYVDFNGFLSCSCSSSSIEKGFAGMEKKLFPPFIWLG